MPLYVLLKRNKQINEFDSAMKAEHEKSMAKARSKH
jgi:hypothetical protein